MPSASSYKRNVHAMVSDFDRLGNDLSQDGNGDICSRLPAHASLRLLLLQLLLLLLLLFVAMLKQSDH